MEMSFPHKSIRGQDLQEAKLDADQRNAHEALLAFIIARQATSPTAKLFVSHQGDTKAIDVGMGKRSMEDRMHFFAGKSSHLDRRVKGDSMFLRGTVRPRSRQRLIMNALFTLAI